MSHNDGGRGSGTAGGTCHTVTRSWTARCGRRGATPPLDPFEPRGLISVRGALAEEEENEAGIWWCAKSVQPLANTDDRMHASFSSSSVSAPPNRFKPPWFEGIKWGRCATPSTTRRPQPSYRMTRTACSTTAPSAVIARRVGWVGNCDCK